MRWCAIVVGVVAAGCGVAAPRPSPPAVVLLGAQLQRQDEQLAGQHFRTLLDFEHPADTAFVRAAARESADGHTGSHALRSAVPATVRVSSVTFGAALPGEWTLVGGYVRVAAGGDVAATLLADGREVGRASRPLPPGVWGLVAVDLTPPDVAGALADAATVELRFDGIGNAGGIDRIDLDDVMLIDNRRELASGAWSVRRRGLTIEVDVPGRPVLTLAAAGASGWVVDEANALRLRLHDAAGRRHWTLLPDGRSIVDGHADGHVDGGDTPAAGLTLDDADGRLDRQTPGDADNDGYNEVRAAYQVVARRSRLTITLRPAADAATEASTGPAAAPLLEITGLPPGPCTATAAGQLIDRVVRLDDGTVLVRPPLTAGSATEVTVNASGN